VLNVDESADFLCMVRVMPVVSRSLSTVFDSLKMQPNCSGKHLACSRAKARPSFSADEVVK
jgi:hypothetical protein